MLPHPHQDNQNLSLSQLIYSHYLNVSRRVKNQLIILIVSRMSLIPLTPQGIITNTLVCLLLYILNGRIEKYRIN